ncbi:hypothetical protein ACFFQF_13525 [Haladaptatus pallidirubidus]|uniref:Gins51 C-terminal domain-containing protein n=1 Tax=Haladaptatus pallidirubidus TaxID=1008152 RepID=A0AAV3UDJ2_9EURY|nr:hypothetical protein [Haladaptatus pallidirubidus]
MNLDELRSVQSKERSKDSLQHLRESFYEDVGSYIGSLRDERERAAERADNPFDSSDVNRLTDEIQTAEDVVQAIYERRVGKVVKRASLSAAGIPADEEGLTSEEQELFADLVERIESNKSTVLDVLAGNGSDGNPTESAVPTGMEPADSAPDGAESAESRSAETGPGTETPEPETPTAEPKSESEDHRSSAEVAAVADNPEDSGTESEAASSSTTAVETGDEMPDDTDGSGTAGEPKPSLSNERTTVRITRDIGEILGVDEREYDLASEDVVTLPAENAGPLIERDAAEKLE